MGGLRRPRPYFAVLTAPKFLRAQLTADAEREFFGSGEALVDYMFRLVEARLAPDFAPTSILEYGCGVGRLGDPARPEGRAARWDGRCRRSLPVRIDALLSNAGDATWLPSDVSPGGVSLGVHLYDGSGQLLQFDMHREPLSASPRAIAPGETIRCLLTLPPQQAGRYVIELDCVSARVAWFGPLGSRTVRLPMEVVGGS